MHEILALRFVAPLMSFGAEVVGAKGPIRPFPAQSMVTGLLANALGYDRSESDKLQALQGRIRFAVRRDRPGTKIQDFQTVDLTTPHMDGSTAWTTRGRPQERTGSGKSRHIRQREYWADAGVTVALELEDPEQTPTLQDLHSALRAPARPLFLGRKGCSPSRPLSDGILRAQNLLDALAEIPLLPGANEAEEFEAWWPADIEGERPTSFDDLPVHDLRDWANSTHTGQRYLQHGLIRVRREDVHE